MGNNWNSFMQSRPARLAMNGLCAVLCAYYALDAVGALVAPERFASFIEMIGVTGYYLLHGARLILCVWLAIVFGRMTLRVAAEHDDGDEHNGDGSHRKS